MTLDDMALADEWELREDIDLSAQDEWGLDAELVRRGGLHEFIKLAWHLVEPGEFQDNWHIGAGCEHLQAVTEGEIQNLLILQPPGTMKSLEVSTFWPVWDWIVLPHDKFIFSSYGQSLSNKNAKQHRDLVKSDWFQNRWGESVQISPDSTNQVKLFETTAKGFRFSTSVGGEVTGRHGNRLVFDDLVKAQDATGKPVVTDKSAIYKANEFWFKVMSTREADPKTTSRVGIMQRLHESDTAGLCIEKGNYTILRLPMRYEPKYHCHTSWKRKDSDEEATFDDPRTEEGELLWEQRFDEERIEELEQDLGPTAFAAQEQQRPVPIGGGIFKVDWFQHWRPDPRTNMPIGINKWHMLIASWDMSFKKSDTADYVCGQIWGLHNADLFLLDLVWARMDFNEAIDSVKSLYIKWPKARKKLVEEAANGTAVVKTLERKIPGLELVVPEGGKEARAFACEPYWHSRNIWLPPQSVCSQVEELKKQHQHFPFAAHDDAVDAGTQAVLYLTGKSHSRYVLAMRKLKEQNNGRNRSRVQVPKQSVQARGREDVRGTGDKSPARGKEPGRRKVPRVRGSDHARALLRKK